MTAQFDDNEIEELTRQLNEKWITSAPPRSALDEADKAMAARLLNKHDLDRFDTLKSGERFRPTPPPRPKTTRKIQFFYVPAKPGVYTSYEGWSIDVYQGARKRNLYHSLADAKAAFCLSRLVEMGHTVEILITEAMKRAGVTKPPAPGNWTQTPERAKRVSVMRVGPSALRPMAKPRQERSKRFEMMEQLRGFKR